MLQEDVGDEMLGEFLCGIGSVGGDKDCLLHESTDDDENRVKGHGEREGFDVVHGDRRPRSLADGQGLKKSVRFVSDGFCSCAGVTTTDIGSYVFSESWPEKQPIY